MAKVEMPNPKEYWDIFANRSSGQFPEGTPIDLIANEANFQYGNPYPELDDEGIGIHPITKRDQGGLSFNTNLGAVATGTYGGINPETKVDSVVPGGANVSDLQVSTADQEAQAQGYENVADMLRKKAPSPPSGIIETFKNPWVLGGIALAALIILLPKRKSAK